MAESMTVRITRTIVNSGKSVRGEKRAELLAVASDIRAGLDEGWTLRSIHQTLLEEKKISCSYQRLRDFTATHIRDSRQTHSRPTSQASVSMNPIPGSETLNQKPRAWNARPDPKEIF